jgi:hypothetical protein
MGINEAGFKFMTGISRSQDRQSDESRQPDRYDQGENKLPEQI